MTKKTQILFLGLAIILSGSALAQRKTAVKGGKNARTVELKNGRTKVVKPKKAPLFTKSTTIFSEDFSNGLPVTWTIHDMDNDGFNWEYDTLNLAMRSYSYDNDSWTALSPNNWLVTPEIVLPNANVSLSYRVWGLDPNYPNEHYTVKISPSGSALLDSFNVNLLTDTIQDGNPTTKYLSLNQYAGDTIRLAFVHHDSVDMFAMVLDDIEVASLDSIDLAVVGTNVRAFTNAGNNLSFTADVFNTGTNNLSNVSVYCDINGTIATATIPSIASLQQATATFTGINLSTIGNTTFKFYVAVSGDTDNSNDTLTITTNVTPAASLTWDFEGDTNLPAGFLAVSYDGATAYSIGFFPNNEPWTVFDDTDYDYMEETPYPEGGTNAAMAESWFDEDYVVANRWLITPRILLTSGNLLSWDAMSMDADYLETYRVRISTTNTDTASFNILTTIDEEDGEWTHHIIDLSAYTGQTVRIAFQLISDDMFRLLVDNIKILGNATLAGDEPPVGIDEADNDVRIYPNPTSGNIRISANAQITLVELIDMTGRIVMTQTGDVKSLNISALTEGIYTLRVVSENGVSLNRVVKK